MLLHRIASIRAWARLSQGKRSTHMYSPCLHAPDLTDGACHHPFVGELARVQEGDGRFANVRYPLCHQRLVILYTADFSLDDLGGPRRRRSVTRMERSVAVERCVQICTRMRAHLFARCCTCAGSKELHPNGRERVHKQMHHMSRYWSHVCTRK